MHEKLELSERERHILHAVVRYYVTTAEPAGSRAVTRRFDLGISPATVRNTMADLEEMGLLKQLHTRSGRVPTESGYRFYVDNLMQHQEISLEDRECIDREFAARLADADAVLQQTSHLLALVSHQAAFAEAPRESASEVCRIELMCITERRLALLIADNLGRVRSLPVDPAHPVSELEAEKLSAFLNAHLSGVTVSQVVPTLSGQVERCDDEDRLLAEQALAIVQSVPALDQGTVFLDGTMQLFEQPEFRDIDRARQVVGILDEREQLQALLAQAASENETGHAMVLISSEDGTPGDGLSLVTAPYRVSGTHAGMLGVLGPQRMPYQRLTALVDYTAVMVGNLLDRYGK